MAVSERVAVMVSWGLGPGGDLDLGGVDLFVLFLFFFLNLVAVYIGHGYWFTVKAYK